MTQTIKARFVESDVDKVFAGVNQCELPGVAVAIAIDGTPVYRKGFGLANLELPTLLGPSMRMRIGSTTKHFAALAYLLLCEDGLAGIDDEIGKYVPRLHPVNAKTSMRRLMNHTNGIRDVLSVTMAFHGVGRPLTDKEMVAYYETMDDIEFEAGTHWNYNNGAYILLTAAIEKIANKPLDDVLRERIFTPIGMHDTMLRRWDTDFVPNSATLHFRDATGSFCRLVMGMEVTGAGGMVSTMDDMLIWLKHMDAPFVGSARTWQLMREPARLANGTSTQYGLGLVTERYRGAEVVHHGGTVMGGNSQMIKVPDARLDVSIATNRTDVSAAMLAHAVIDACVDGLEPVPAPGPFEKQNAAFVSKRNGRVVTLSAANDMQFVLIDGSPPMPTSPDRAGVLRLPAIVSFIQQSVRIEGDEIVLNDFGNEERLSRITTDAAAQLGSRAGTYRCDAMDVTLELIDDGVAPRAVSRGRHGQVNFRAAPITADIWRIEDIQFPSMGLILTFHKDGPELSLDTGRMRRVRFRRAS